MTQGSDSSRDFFERLDISALADYADKIRECEYFL